MTNSVESRRVTRLESMNPSRRTFILMGGPQAHRKLTTRVLTAIAFYEKVIKVKADVAAFLINCFPSA
jgi:hypothetical protein